MSKETLFLHCCFNSTTILEMMEKGIGTTNCIWCGRGTELVEVSSLDTRLLFLDIGDSLVLCTKAGLHVMFDHLVLYTMNVGFSLTPSQEGLDLGQRHALFKLDVNLCMKTAELVLLVALWRLFILEAEIANTRTELAFSCIDIRIKETLY